MNASFSAQTFQHRFSVILASIAILLALTGLSGWIFDSFLLRSFLSDGATMKVNTALMLITAGLSIISLSFGWKKTAYLFLFILTLFCVLTLSEYIFNLNLKIDELLIHDLDTNPTVEIPGRMSILTSIYGIMIAVSIFLTS